MLIRPIQAQDNVQIARVIRQVLEEHKVPKVGTAYADPCLDKLYEYYQNDRGQYFIIESEGKVVAGCGFGSLPKEPETLCELQKMYFLPEARGKGWGKALIAHCLQSAKTMGYTECYLETLDNMQAAQQLYQKLGFQYIAERKGATGHNACPIFMLKLL